MLRSQRTLRKPQPWWRQLQGRMHPRRWGAQISYGFGQMFAPGRRVVSASLVLCWFCSILAYYGAIQTTTNLQTQGSDG